MIQKEKQNIKAHIEQIKQNTTKKYKKLNI